MAEITIDFTDIDWPLEEPFDKNQPEKQRENAAYVFLQIVRKLKQNAYTLTFPENSTIAGDVETILTEIRDHISDLKFNGQQVTYSTKDAKIKVDLLGQYTTGG